MAKIDKQILELLKENKPLTLVEIAEKLGKTEKTVYRALKRLFSKGNIDCEHKTRSYTISKE